ncbi:GD23339 [Drosophila simulans]|uniref:GD23339 n=1 Tax=Drosophila simulans TaxID=7240 RepID=B4Q3L3_DROSI|nr:GD23339 [Drosophila simulans]
MGSLRVEWQWEVVAHKINGWIVDVDPPASSLQRIRILHWHKVLYEVVENPMVVPWSQWLSSVIIADCTLISVMCEP